MGIGHLCRTVYVNALKLRFTLPQNPIFFDFGNLIVAFRPGANLIGFPSNVPRCRSVKEPERNVNALDFGDMIVSGKCSREKFLAPLVAFQGRNRCLFVKFKGNDVIWL